MESMLSALSGWGRGRSSEDLAYVVESVDERIDVGARVVHGKRRPRRRRDAEALHQRLRAVVAGPHADTARSEDLGDVVRVGDVQREGDERPALGGVQRA